ncbi:MFS transporter [Nakamurella silvestris]|nr:MFS transporter [Nakamurella silvestris]
MTASEAAVGTRGGPWPFGKLAVLAAALAMTVTTEMVPMGLLPLMSRDLDTSESTVGLLVTAYALVVAVTAIPLTRFTTTWERRTLFLWILAAFVLSNLLMALAQEYWMAATARLIGGVGHALFFSVVGVFASRLVSPDRVGRAVALVWAGSSISFTLGVPLGTALGASLGWRATFAVLAGLSLILLVVAALLLPALPGSARTEATSLRRMLRLPALRTVVAAIGLLMLGQYILYTYVSPLLIRTGLSESAVGPVLFGYGAAGVLGMWVSGVLSDRRPRAALLGGVGLLVLVIVGLMVVADSAPATVVVVVFWGIAFGVMPGLFQAGALRATPQSPDTGAALYNVSFNIGIGGGALIGGQAMDAFGIDSLPPIALAVVLFGLVVVLRGRAGFPSRISTDL